ncbi:MAG TPA: protein tyrosine phosphatase family protein [Gammaproteobacteria bacterium]
MLKRILAGLSLLLLGAGLGIFLYVQGPHLPQRSEYTLPPQNLMVFSERLHSSGQPNAEQLAALSAAGYDLVINLAPPDVIGAVAEEARLVTAAGAAYVNIPVAWEQPRYTDFTLFSALLRNAGERRVLVHCQANMRASVFVFLYRVIHEQADPDTAYDDVLSLWVPDVQWSAFIRETLARHGIEFTP